MTLRRPASVFVALLIVLTAIAPRPAAAWSRGRRPALVAPGTPATPLDQPMNVAWPAINAWNDGFEREYSEFVQRLGRAVSERRCRRLDECLRSPSNNSVFDASVDARLAFSVDCADLPYILRAYFSYKRKLPFGFVSHVRGRGHDPRYMVRITPDAWKQWREFATPRTLLRELSRTVHSGMYRTAPEIETADFYSAAIDRRGVRPGSIFYDPNGHVLVVTEVRPDGAVYMMDGHPDGSLTYKRFGQAFVVGTAVLGGGFKNFRPVALRAGHLVRAPNTSLTNYGGRAQFDSKQYVVAEAPSTYHLWVRTKLAEVTASVDPVNEFREQVRALCRDVADRVEAVDAALAVGIQNQAHPAALPQNIYGTDGDWELYSTPSRDARLKAAFRELRETVAAVAGGASVGHALRAAWHEETSRADCSFGYTNSAGRRVVLSMDTVLDRLFTMSFDPYHCPELRWGAPDGSAERASCHDDAVKLRWYRDEQRLRNRIDREYGTPTPLEFGPTAAPDVDARRLLNAMGGPP